MSTERKQDAAAGNGSEEKKGAGEEKKSPSSFESFSIRRQTF